MRSLILICLLSPAVALADGPIKMCDPATVTINADVRDPLFNKLKSATSELEAAPHARLLWQDFFKAPDPHAQTLLDRGARRIQYLDLTAAIASLDELVAYCPGYAEGWNQRAFAHFLSGSYDAALEDLDAALEIEPRHFGALSGKVLTLLKQGRQALAIGVLREALKVHPWMQERRYLPKGEKI